MLDAILLVIGIVVVLVFIFLALALFAYSPLLFFIIGAGIIGLFIHPLLTLLAGILAAIVWHGAVTSKG